MTTKELVIAYVVVVLAIALLDLLWLGVIAKPLYMRGMGHLMAEQPNFVAAALFYLVFAAGLMVFVLLPSGAQAGYAKLAITGALFGFFCYSVYDLTNLAVLKDWPVGLSIIDVAWGTLVGGVSVVAAKAVLKLL